MAHELDFTKGRAAIAYAGETPWHRHGQQLDPNVPRETWQVEAGLDYQVLESTVLFQASPEILPVPSKKVLYRSDTNTPLSVVGKNYKVVQPDDVLDFFQHLIELGGFRMEVAGALMGGSRIWALARVSDDAQILSQDRVRPYLLLATGYDGQFATTAKFVATRVVCWNTIQIALSESSDSVVRIPHNLKFNPDRVREQLVIADLALSRWMQETRRLAETPLSDPDANDFLIRLLPPSESIAVEETAAYRRLMALYQGQDLIGAEIDGGETRWRMLNAVTQFVDHERGTDRTRLNSAWFGPGNALKNRAFSLLSEGLV